jgi:hypothetical protein
MPDLDKTVKEHLKGQHQGTRSTKQKAFEKMIEVEEARKKLKETPHLSAHSHQPNSTTYSCAWRT